MAQQIILITGTNRGIGLGIGKAMAALGWQVIATGRTQAKAEEAAHAIGHGAIGIALDVTSEDSVREAADQLAKRFDHLDVLINNAGVMGNHPMQDFDLPQISHVMDANFMGPIRTSKYFLPLLRKSHDGRMVNVSSGMGELASLESGGYGAYRLSKTSLNAFTILLAAELRSTSVKVMAMCPGWVKTDMGGVGASRSVEQGAETAIWLSTANDVQSGKFYRDKKIIAW
jgi:NAD(P)-dependent dehydrogenase (short-subunit alcohol dehydrogenase family)